MPLSGINLYDYRILARPDPLTTGLPFHGDLPPPDMISLARFINVLLFPIVQPRCIISNAEVKGNSQSEPAVEVSMINNI